MDVRLLTTDPLTLDSAAAELLVVLLPTDQSQWRLSKGLQVLLSEAVTVGDLALKAGKTLYLHRPAGLRAARLLACVVGPDGAKALHAAGLAVLAQMRNGAPRAWTVVDGSDKPALDTNAWCEGWVRAVHDGAYVYRHTKPSADATALPKRLNLVVPAKELAAARSGVARGQAIAAGVDVAKECANRPANHCTPSDLAQRARDLGRSHGFGVEVLDRKAVEKLKMGAFLSVANGSPEPLKFIVMRYEGADKKQAPLVLVGKGITFDTGGISIKPAAGMDEMKFDMGGAASVLGTFRAIGELKPRINLIGLIPTCENMPSGTATRPGDVVTAMSGLTIEVLNTDAEGRLILCDALTYAERFKPAAVVDIATLTGACVVALGHHRSGLFCADDALAQELSGAGQAAMDPAWRMPLDDEYAAGLKSHFADMGNVGPREGGAITAAMFLKRFTQAYPWAHLDIAGTAWRSGAAKGATGRPVPLLTAWVLTRAEVAQARTKVADRPVTSRRRTPRATAQS